MWLSCVTLTQTAEKEPWEPVETEKGKSCRSRVGETCSLMNQEEKRQQGMV